MITISRTTCALTAKSCAQFDRLHSARKQLTHSNTYSIHTAKFRAPLDKLYSAGTQLTHSNIAEQSLSISMLLLRHRASASPNIDPETFLRCTQCLDDALEYRRREMMFPDKHHTSSISSAQLTEPKGIRIDLRPKPLSTFDTNQQHVHHRPTQHRRMRNLHITLQQASTNMVFHVSIQSTISHGNTIHSD
jgi:hypothetical protein